MMPAIAVGAIAITVRRVIINGTPRILILHIIVRTPLRRAVILAMIAVAVALLMMAAFICTMTPCLREPTIIMQVTRTATIKTMLIWSVAVAVGVLMMIMTVRV